MLKTLPILVLGGLLGYAAFAESGSGRSNTATKVAAQQRNQKQHVGVSVPSKFAQIAAEQSGTIVSMPVKEGQGVERNQILFELSSKLQRLRVQRLEALSKSSLAVEKTRAAMEHSAVKMKRLMELSEREIASAKELQERELELALARMEHQQAMLDKTVTNFDLEQSRELLAQRTIHSPFTGIVTQIMRQVGETSEKLVPVLEVAKLDPLWVEFECPVSDEAQFRRGASVVVSPAYRRSESRIGTVIYVSMKANPSSHTFRVRIRIPNKDHSWKSGLKMFIRLPEESEIPRAAPK